MVFQQTLSAGNNQIREQQSVGDNTGVAVAQAISDVATNYDKLRTNVIKSELQQDLSQAALDFKDQANKLQVSKEQGRLTGSFSSSLDRIERNAIAQNPDKADEIRSVSRSYRGGGTSTAAMIAEEQAAMKAQQQMFDTLVERGYSIDDFTTVDGAFNTEKALTQITQDNRAYSEIGMKITKDNVERQIDLLVSGVNTGDSDVFGTLWSQDYLSAKQAVEGALLTADNSADDEVAIARLNDFNKRLLATKDQVRQSMLQNNRPQSEINATLSAMDQKYSGLMQLFNTGMEDRAKQVANVIKGEKYSLLMADDFLRNA